MVERFLKALGVEVSEVESSSITMIPFEEARLCINCEHIIRNSVCPMCGSKYHMVLGNVLGLMKTNRDEDRMSHRFFD
jgi:rRNA maturation endonuclease Nob1